MRIDLRGWLRATIICTAVYLLLIFLCGCTPTKYATQKQINKAEFYFPELLYEWCSENAKEQRDSSTVLDISYTPAANENYQAIIDSLVKESNSKIPDAPIIDTCKKVVEPYLKKISDLNSIIATLKAKYKPCVPDTVLINSKTKVINDLTAGKKLQELENKKLKDEISELKATNIRQQATIKNKNLWIIGLSVISAALAILTYFGWRKR